MGSTSSSSSVLYALEPPSSKAVPEATVLRFNLGLGQPGLQKYGGLKRGSGPLADFSMMSKRYVISHHPLLGGGMYH
jgi:hypothetical protein